MERLSTGLVNNLVGATGFAATFERGIMEIYSGTQPASADAAPTGVLLGVVTLNSGAFTPGVVTNGLTFGAPVDGVVSKTGVWSFNAIATGTAGWFRLKANALDNNTLSTTLPRLDGSIAASGADLNFRTDLAIGAPTTIDSFSWTQPKS
jgi:hypothetical protein